MEDIRKFKKGINLEPVSSTDVDAKGDMEVLDSSGKLNYHNGTTASPMVTEAHTTTFTNKTIDGDVNTVQDLALTSLKTNLTDANKFLVRDGSGIVVSNTKDVPTGVVVGDTDTQTLTNKTLTSPIINTPDINGATLSLNDSDSAFNLEVQSTSTLTQDRTLTLDVNDADRTLTLSANVTLDGNEVKGPASATDEALARFDSTTGKLLQNSVITATDAGIMSGITQLNVDNLRLDGNTLSSTDTNGNVVLDPDGTGQISAEAPMRMSEQASSPSTPASGYSVLYPKTDGYLYYKNDAGAETRIQSGSGGINYILNSDAEGGTTGWATYADAAGTVPVDGTGGSPNITLTASASSPLRGLQSFLITKDAANRQGQGVSYDFTIDPADKSKVLKISYDFEASSAYTGLSGTEYMVTYVYDITNGIQIPASNIYMAQGSGTQEVVFNASTSTSYRLEFHIAGTGASAWTYKYDNVMVGPQEVVLSAAISDFTSYTPTIVGIGTVSNVDVKYRQVGDSLEINGKFTAGTPTAVAPTISLPSGLLVDSSMLNASPLYLLGEFYVAQSSLGQMNTTSAAEGILTNNTTTNTNLVFAFRSQTNAFVIDNADTFFVSGTNIAFNVKVKIANWSSNIQLNNSRVEYASNSGMGDADDTTSFVNNPAGNSLPTVGYTGTRKKRIRFQNPIQASDTIQVQLFDFTSGSWQDWASTNQTTQPLYRAGGAFYGFGGLQQINSTDMDIIFGEYRREGAVAWGNAGDSWSGTSASWKWRVVKYSNAVPVTVEPKATAEYSFITAAGYGSTNTAIPYYTTASIASDTKGILSVSNSSTLGLSVTALKKCSVWMAFPMGYTGTADYKGITKNSTQLSTTIDSVTNSVVRFKTFSASSTVTEVMAKVPMEIGDVLRPHLATGLTLNGYMIYISAEEI